MHGFNVYFLYFFIYRSLERCLIVAHHLLIGEIVQIPVSYSRKLHLVTVRQPGCSWSSFVPNGYMETNQIWPCGQRRVFIQCDQSSLVISLVRMSFPSATVVASFSPLRQSEALNSRKRGRKHLGKPRMFQLRLVHALWMSLSSGLQRSSK